MIDHDLMSAILSMDTYHRGYNAGLQGSASVTGDRIGLWDVGASSAIFRGPNGELLDQNIGFYAQSYSHNGETIIAYRGTDNHRAGDARIASDGGGQGFTIWPADRANPAGLKSALRDLRAGPLKDKDVKVLVREASGAARVATLTELAAEATLDRGATS